MWSIGVIVTYNRKELLVENLRMLSMQSKKLDSVIIIDNHGTDNTREFIEHTFDLNDGWIDYIYMEENTGGAGGFYYGLKRAYDKNADLIWLMDDDGKPYNNETFKNIYDAAEQLYSKNKKLFLNSLVTINGKDLSFGYYGSISLDKQREMINAMEDRFLFGKANPFNGTLISKETVRTVGFPNKDFFLTRDETDYFRRCQDAGVLIATVIDSIYCHPKSKLVHRKMGKIFVQTYADLDKEYYFIRNVTFSYKEKHKFRIILLIGIRILTILFYENHKRRRLLQIPEALSDALHNRMGKRREKR